MATYGVDFYAGATYGQASLLEFDAQPFYAKPFAYGSVRLLWSSPTGAWSRIRLVRSGAGFPVTELDGIVLVDSNSGPAATGTIAPPITSYDDLNLTQGAFYYYSLFVLTDIGGGVLQWKRAGDAIGLAPRNYRYVDKMFDRIPSVYTTAARETGGKPDATSRETVASTDPYTFLFRFISIFGFDLDFIRTQYDTLRDLYNPDKVSGGMLPILAEQFGLAYEPEIGIRQTRIVVRNLLNIRKRKGTQTAVLALASAFTGWSSSAARGYNLLLDYDDSSFEDSLGRWRAEANCTVTRQVADATVAAYASTLFNNRQAGFLAIACTGGQASVRLLQGGRDPITFGVPVVGGSAYSVSAFLRAGQAATRSTALDIEWYDQRGLLISTATGTGTANVFGNWSAQAAAANVIAPANAAYAGLAIRVIGALAGETHFVDAVQLEQSATVRTYQEARDIRIALRADRINEVRNPSAEVNTIYWTGDTNSTLGRVTTFAFSGDEAVLAPASSQAASFSVTATAAGDASMLSEAMPVLSNTPYTLTAYAHSPASRSFRVDVQWFDATNVQVGTSVGAVQTTNGLKWFRAGVTSISPATAATARARVVVIGAAAAELAYLDAVLLERSIQRRVYFDASTTNQRPSDYLWEGGFDTGQHNSRSHYYFNRTTKNLRLTQLMKQHLALGSSFSLLYAQPGLS